MIRKIILALVCLLAPLSVRAQVSVSGNLKDAGIANVTNANSYARFTLENYGANIPKVTSSNVIAVPYKDFHPDGNGNISGTLQGNDTIDPSQTFYQVCIYYQGQQFRCATYSIGGTSFNLNSAVPLVVSPTAQSNILTAKTYEFSQGSPATTWTIPHNFGDRNVLFNCYDLTGTYLLPESAVETDVNTLTVTFASAQAGSCTLMNAANVSTTPAAANVVVTNPVGTQTLDAHPLVLQGTLTAQAGGELDGNYAGNPTFTGNPTVSGNLTLASILGNPLFSGNPTVSGTATFNGPLVSNDLTASSSVANKAPSADAERWVDVTGSDSNDGLSAGSPKATISAANSTLPTCTPVPSTAFSVTPTAPCGTIHLAPGTYTVSSLLTINGLMTRIIGAGKAATTISCPTASITCIEFNNQSPYAFAPSMSVDGGLYNLTVNGGGSGVTSQVGVFGLTADGMAMHDVRISNFSGTGSVGAELLNDNSGGITERLDWNNVAFDNDTTELLLTTSGASNNTSFGHNALRHLQFSLANGQTAISLGGSGSNGGAGLYGSYVDGVINAADTNSGHSATAIAITGTAKVLGQFRLIIDNGAGLAITACTGCTTSNFNVWGFGDGATGFDATNGNLTTFNGGVRMNASSSALGSGPAWYLDDVLKMQAILDGSNGLAFYNASNSPVFGISQTGLESQSGLQIFNTSTTCTTGSTVGATCTTAAITLPVAEPDTFYRVVCVPKTITNVPAVVTTTNSSATQFTITIAALTAAAATAAAFDCFAGHN